MFSPESLVQNFGVRLVSKPFDIWMLKLKSLPSPMIWRSLEVSLVSNDCLLRNYQQVGCRRKGSVKRTCKTKDSQIPGENEGSKPCLRRANSSTRMMRNSLQEG